MKAFTLILMLFFAFSAQATSVTATSDGDWDQATTWGGDTPPGCYDSIVIPAGVTVTITGTIDLEACPETVVFVYGTLLFQTGKKLKLPCGNSAVVIFDTGYLGVGGGGGASTYVEICTAEWWNAGTGDIDGSVDGTTVLGTYPLPIELTNFDAQLIKRQTHVSWTTESEINNDYFTVERSADGTEWNSIGVLAGAGNSSETIDYEFIDESPKIGINYYRLRQTDYDGASEIFDPVAVNNKGVYFDTELLVFPNPSGGDQITIFLTDYSKDEVEVELISVSGKVVLNKKLSVSDSGFVVVKLDSQPSAGYYAIKASGEIEKLVFH